MTDPCAPPSAPTAEVAGASRRAVPAQLPWPGAEPAAGSPPREPWAVVAAVAAALALVPVAVPAALVALVRLSRHPGGHRRGTALAWSALALALVEAALAAAAVVWLLGRSLVEFPAGPSAAAAELLVGSCVRDLARPSAVPCAEAHDGEVFAVLEAPEYADPRSWAADVCLAEFEPYVGIDYADSERAYTAYVPSAAEWRQGERTVTCLLTSASSLEAVRESLRGSGS